MWRLLYALHTAGPACWTAEDGRREAGRGSGLPEDRESSTHLTRMLNSLLEFGDVSHS